jgi:hypothetical protein
MNTDFAAEALDDAIALQALKDKIKDYWQTMLSNEGEELPETSFIRGYKSALEDSAHDMLLIIGVNPDEQS